MSSRGLQAVFKQSRRDLERFLSGLQKHYKSNAHLEVFVVPQVVIGKKKITVFRKSNAFRVIQSKSQKYLETCMET